MRKLSIILITWMSALTMGVINFSFTLNPKIVEAENEINVTATNITPNPLSGNNGVSFTEDRITGLYFNLESNAAPYKSDWTLEYKITAANNFSILKADGTYIENANEGCIGSGEIVKFSDVGHYIKFEPWTFKNNTVSYGDKVIMRGAFSYSDGTNNYSYNFDETTFLITGTNKNNCGFIIMPNETKNISEIATSFTMPEYNDQKWHFQFLAKGVTPDVIPFTNDGDELSKYAYVSSSNKNIYVDGNPVAKFGVDVFKRRDTWLESDALLYVCNEANYQNLELNLNQVLVFDGLFILNKPGTSFGITFDKLSFVRIGSGTCDYKYVDLYDYLYQLICDTYVVDLYNEDDRNTISEYILNTKDALDSKESVEEIYEVYNTCCHYLDQFEYDEEAAKEYIKSLKRSAIEEISNYANLDNCFENEKELIINKLEEYIEKINNASKKSEIETFVQEYKAFVDSVLIDVDVMKKAIENQESGYEQYLNTSDTISLNDLNLNSVTFHGLFEERANDFNSNNMSNSLVNTFTPSNDNKDGNVRFKFNYTPNATPIAGANAMIVLRGIPLYGYKFAIDTDSRGCYVEILDEAGNSKWGGGSPSYLFTNNQTYKVEIAAIDLVRDVKITWLYIKVNGVLVYQSFQDSLGICINPRVGLSSNGNWEENNSYEGSVTLTSLEEGLSNNPGKHVGLFSINNYENNVIHGELKDNNLPVSRFYPTSKSSIRLIRNNEELNIANPEVASLIKNDDNNYSLSLSNLTNLLDNDQIIIHGAFAYYDNDNDMKHSFFISKSPYIYHQASNSFEFNLSLEDAKENAIIELENYLDMSLYDESDYENINNIINQGIININSASSIEMVNEALRIALENLNNIQTTLQKAKLSAISFVNSYKNDELDNYRLEEQEELNRLKEQAISDINNALNELEINDILNQFINSVDTLLTKKEHEEIELKDAKKEGSQKVKDHYASVMDLNKFSKEKIQELNNATIKALEDIKTANSVDDVNNIVNNYINTYPLPKDKTPTNNNASTGIIIGASIGGTLVLLGIGAFLFIKLRKKKEN